MKGTLQEQLMEAAKSGKLKASNMEKKMNSSELNIPKRAKKDIHFDEDSSSFMEKLFLVGIDESSSEVNFPACFGDVDRFIDKIVYARNERIILSPKKFFCLVGLARLKKTECERSSFFKQEVTNTARDILTRKKMNVTIDEMKWENFERAFKTVASLINHNELDVLLMYYEKDKSQEEQEKKRKEISCRLSEIKEYLKVYDFAAAEKLHGNFRELIPKREYNDLVKKYQAKQKEKIVVRLRSWFEKFDFVSAKAVFQKNKEIIGNDTYDEMRLDYSEKFSLKKLTELIDPYLDKFDFATADKLYQENQDDIWDKHYKKAKDRAIAKHREEKIFLFLRERNYTEADKIAGEKTLYFSNVYLPLKAGFVGKDIQSIAKVYLSDRDVKSFAVYLVHNAPEIANSLSFEAIARFVLDDLSNDNFPPSIYGFIIEKTSKDIQEGLSKIDPQKISLAAIKFLQSQKIAVADKKNVWIIFLAYPTILKELLKADRVLLAKIDDAYPFDRIDEIAEVHLPSEELCLQYLKNKKFQLNERTLGKLKEVFESRRYFNCKMIIAFLEAKRDGKKIRSNDVLLGLLQGVINKIFNYNLEAKDPIKNLIFPKCISDFNQKNFTISDENYLFCEGKRTKLIDENGNPVVICRNRRCYEMDCMKNDSYFFDFLKEKFSISENELFSNQNFVRGMGSFNRWNEIAHRLVCGYDGEDGCGSPLICSSIHQVKSGWAAYAVTYWCCSNTSCEKQSETVKLSHCGGGCGKIIDSRIDKIRCNRTDEKDFYICLGCGFCCKKHKVSGICPECGKHEGWDTIDQHSKWYSCRSCGHEIAVPGKQKGCLGTENTGRALKIREAHGSGNKQYTRRDYGNPLSDGDISF